MAQVRQHPWAWSPSTVRGCSCRSAERAPQTGGRLSAAPGRQCLTTVVMVSGVGGPMKLPAMFVHGIGTCEKSAA